MNLAEFLKLERGSTSRLAVELGVSQPLVSEWATGRKRIPLDYCPFIERFTAEKVTCEELRPDRVEYFRKLSERTVPQPSIPVSSWGQPAGEDA
jgi:DNA-binding transcriptional regulator YdaS (Cro superfamily)